MFLWWSDPYTGLTVALLVLTVALAVKVLSPLRRSAQFGRPGKVIFLLWLLVGVPWAYITSLVAHGLGTERRVPAPDVKLLLSDGRTNQLKNLHGKVVLFDFWATWCAPCRASDPAVADLASRFGPEGLVVVGISADENEGTWRRYLELQPHSARRRATATVRLPNSSGSMADQHLCSSIVKVAFVGSRWAGRRIVISSYITE